MEITNNQKLLLGAGAIALAYWLYKRKGSGISRQAPTNPCKYPNEVPCDNGSGKCYSIVAKYSQDPCKVDNPCPQGQVLQVVNCIKAPCPQMCVDINTLDAPNMPRVKPDRELVFEFTKDYQSDPNRATTRMISWNFKKGQKIKGMPDYANCSFGGGVCPIKTTTKGEFQTSQNQMYWITIPQGYLKIDNFSSADRGVFT